MTSNNLGLISFQKLKVIIIAFLATIFVAGCSTTEIKSGQILVEKKLPHPKTIWVYDFIPAPADMQADASVAETENKTNKKLLNPEQTQLAILLGKIISKQLVKQISDMGLNSELVESSSKFQINDIVLRGYLYYVEEGSATERIFIGFGYGASSLDTLIVGYQMTPKGIHKLSSANIESAGGKLPGGGATSIPAFILLRNPIALIIGPAIKSVQEISGGPTIKGRAENTASKIADVLKEKFQEEGWIE